MIPLVEFGNRHSSMHQLCLTDTFCYLFSYFGFFLSARVCAELLSVWIIVGQEPTVLAVGASRGCSDNFPVSPIVSLFFLPLSGRRGLDRLKYCFKEPLNPN